MKAGITNNKNESYLPLYESIELRSDDVQEVLSRPPAYLVRNGSMLIGLIILLLLAGSFVFRYPDVVGGKIIITSVQAPVWLTAKTTGKLSELNCHHLEYVNAGQMLAVLENSANTKDMVSVTDLLQQLIITDSVCQYPEEILKESYQLGEVQSSFSIFIKALTAYAIFTQNNTSQQEMQFLKEQLTNRNQYISQLNRQLDIKTNEYDIATEEIEKDKKLYANKVISGSDLANSNKTYLRIKEELQQLSISISYQTIELTEIRNDILRVGNQYIREKKQLLSDIHTAARQLKTEMENWNLRYAIRTPLSGRVSFNAVWKIHQDLNAGDKIFSVVSTNASAGILGKMQINSYAYGKVRSKQTVNIRVDGYPFLEFGLIRGEIVNMPLVSADGFYTIDILLPKGTVTSTGKKIPFNGEITGSAEIITDNRSIFERIMSSLLYLLYKSAGRN